MLFKPLALWISTKTVSRIRRGEKNYFFFIWRLCFCVGCVVNVYIRRPTMYLCIFIFIPVILCAFFASSQNEKQNTRNFCNHIQKDRERERERMSTHIDIDRLSFLNNINFILFDCVVLLVAVVVTVMVSNCCVNVNFHTISISWLCTSIRVWIHMLMYIQVYYVFCNAELAHAWS